jgi:hypothetical protein
MGPGAGLDVAKERKPLVPAGNRNPTVQTSLYRLSYSDFTILRGNYPNNFVF